MIVTMIMRRRPPRKRSIAGPMSGVTTAKGAMVNSRYRATRARDSSGLIEKKMEPARATAMAASEAADTAWSRARRTNGVITNPSAPRSSGCSGRPRGRQPSSLTSSS